MTAPSFAFTALPGPRTNPQGRRVDLDPQHPVESFARKLELVPRSADAGLSVWSFRGDRRAQSEAISAVAIAVDLDFLDEQGRHSPVPAGKLEFLLEDVLAGKYPFNVAHATPRGFRAFAVLQQPESDASRWTQAALGLGELVKTALRRSRLDADRATGLAGFELDSAVLTDRARLLFGPRALVDGVQRDAKVHVVRTEPFDVAELAKLAPVAKPPSTPAPRSRSVAAATCFEEAAATYNQAHARDWGRPGSGECPACGHKACFGRLKDSETRWACFSTNHVDGCGTRGEHLVTGDALDIDAYLAGRTPADHLRAEGYLTAPRLVREEPPPPGDEDAPPLREVSSAYVRSREPGEDDGDDDTAPRPTTSDNFAPGRSCVVALRNAAGSAFDLFARRYYGEEKPLPLPWPSVAAALGGGLWPGMHTETGTTAAGKTAFAIQVALWAARAGHPVLYVGLELDTAQILARLTSLELGETIDGRVTAHWSEIYLGKVAPEVISPALERLRALPIYIEEGPPGGWSAKSLRARVDELCLAHQDRGYRAPLVVLDFLQLVGPTDPGGRREELRERIGAAAYMGREVARKCGAVVLMLSSISRAGASELFQLADRGQLGTCDPAELVGLGKESGDIEFAADSVLTLAREPKAEGASTTNVWLALAKIRAGSPSWCLLRFNGTWFSEVSQAEQDRHAVARLTARAAEKEARADAKRRQDRETGFQLVVDELSKASEPLSLRELRARIPRRKDVIDAGLAEAQARGLAVCRDTKPKGWILTSDPTVADRGPTVAGPRSKCGVARPLKGRATATLDGPHDDGGPRATLADSFGAAVRHGQAPADLPESGEALPHDPRTGEVRP